MLRPTVAVMASGLSRTGTVSVRSALPLFTAASRQQALLTRSFSTSRTFALASRQQTPFSDNKRPNPPRPGGNTSVVGALTSHARFKWSYSRDGVIPSDFSRRHPWISVTLRLVLSAALGIGLITGVVLVHDAFTYNDRHVDRVPTAALALHPRRGGPKNLPIIELNLDDEEDEEKKNMCHKPRLVIVGGGWGAVSVLKSLGTNEYNVTLVSPQTYFLFTPLLPSACVGTVEPRSLVEPIRKLVARVRGHYLQGSAIDVDLSERLLEVELPSDDEGGTMRAYVPYDKLVVAVGSRSNDHGVKGLENCLQLKTIPDAQAVRRRLMDNLERASMPTTTPEERKRLLSFVVCGGGPTGVEFAAELADMLSEDAVRYYPKVLKDDITVSIIQSRDHILNTYNEKISDYAEKRFKRSEINVVTNARVVEVKPDEIELTIKGPDGKTETKTLPSGMTIWSTGIAMQPFTKRLVEALPNQFHSKAVQVDAYLRVLGAPKGTVYAIGDSATIYNNMINDILTLWEKFDSDHDERLSVKEWRKMARYLHKKYPLASGNLEQIQEIFQQFSRSENGELGLNDLADMFMHMSKKTTSLPATAQVASQQGKYLGHMFNKLAKNSKTLEENDIHDLDDETYFYPFKYRHLGSLAYIGNSAVFDFGGMSFTGGLIGMYAWRSIYWTEQVSLRTRVLLMLDWVKRGIFGRDLSRF